MSSLAQSHETAAGDRMADVRAAIVLVIIAIPLCLGIALASGAPLASGLVAGVVGAVVVGSLGGSHLMVSGPAAGLAAIVLAALATLGSFPLFLAAVVIAGVTQIVLGLLRAGIVGYYFPSAVIKGMLAGIGAILVLKQVPHIVGYDADYVGSESFAQAGQGNTFSALATMLDYVHPGAVIVSLVALVVLRFWGHARVRIALQAPAPLVAVISAVVLNALFLKFAPSLALASEHLVQLPAASGPGDWLAFLSFPDLSGFTRLDVWQIGITIALVASLESLFSLEATDKLDEHKRESNANRELLAQGAGNLVSGFVGGLPIAGVIVRSAANVNAGARTRLATVSHGALLLLCVLTIPALLNRIPIAVLAAILLYTGCKLASPELFRATWRLGYSQFIPFLVTAVAIVVTDLLMGLLIGLAVGLFFILAHYLRQPALRVVSPPGAVLVRYQLPEQATFLAKANIERTLEALPRGSRVEIDARTTRRLDYDVLEQLHEFRATARLRDIDYRLVGVPSLNREPI